MKRAPAVTLSGDEFRGSCKVCSYSIGEEKGGGGGKGERGSEEIAPRSRTP